MPIMGQDPSNDGLNQLFGTAAGMVKSGSETALQLKMQSSLIQSQMQARMAEQKAQIEEQEQSTEKLGIATAQKELKYGPLQQQAMYDASPTVTQQMADAAIAQEGPFISPTRRVAIQQTVGQHISGLSQVMEANKNFKLELGSEMKSSGNGTPLYNLQRNANTGQMEQIPIPGADQRSSHVDALNLYMQNITHINSLGRLLDQGYSGFRIETDPKTGAQNYVGTTKGMGGLESSGPMLEALTRHKLGGLVSSIVGSHGFNNIATEMDSQYQATLSLIAQNKDLLPGSRVGEANANRQLPAAYSAAQKPAVREDNYNWDMGLAKQKKAELQVPMTLTTQGNIIQAAQQPPPDQNQDATYDAFAKGVMAKRAAAKAKENKAGGK